jgi:hypothetical protein
VHMVFKTRLGLILSILDRIVTELVSTSVNRSQHYEEPGLSARGATRSNS